MAYLELADNIAKQDILYPPTYDDISVEVVDPHNDVPKDTDFVEDPHDVVD